MKPMLAAKTPPAGHAYRFPLLASPKLDGVRALVRDGKLVSRTLKPIPNLHCQNLFGRLDLEGLDGELVVGPPTGNDVMQRTTSGVMRIEGEPEVTFWVFDMHDHPELRYRDRMALAIQQQYGIRNVRWLTQVPISDQAALDAYEADCLDHGFEGAMVRDPEGLYKFGRSTVKEGGLIKLKRFEDSEAIVVGFEERMRNDNEATVDHLGHTKRSTHQANKVGHGDLGALVCVLAEGWNESTGLTAHNVLFNIGTGFTAAQRVELWAERESLRGRLVKFRHFAAAGVKDAPRFPVFIGFRHPEDV